MRSRLCLLVAAALFSTGGAAIKSCALSSWQVASFRSLVAMVALLVLLPPRRSPSAPMVATGAAYAATMVLFVSANKLTTAASTIFLQSTAPLYMLVLGPWLLREPIRARDLALVAIFLAGLSMFLLEHTAVFASAPKPGLGNLVATASGLSWALTLAGLRRLEKGAEAHSGAATALAIGNAIAFLGCLPFALPAAQPAARDWALVAYLGIFQVGLAYRFLAAGVRHSSALEASLLLLLEPVLNPLWAWLVHGERPGAWTVAGGAVVLGATILKIRLDSRLSPLPPADAAAAGA